MHTYIHTRTYIDRIRWHLRADLRVSGEELMGGCGAEWLGMGRTVRTSVAVERVDSDKPGGVIGGTRRDCRPKRVRSRATETDHQRGKSYV